MVQAAGQYAVGLRVKLISGGDRLPLSGRRLRKPVNRKNKAAGANGFCGYNRKPPIEEAMRKFCNQFS